MGYSTMKRVKDIARSVLGRGRGRLQLPNQVPSAPGSAEFLPGQCHVLSSGDGSDSVGTDSNAMSTEGDLRLSDVPAPTADDGCPQERPSPSLEVPPVEAGEMDTNLAIYDKLKENGRTNLDLKFVKLVHTLGGLSG